MENLQIGEEPLRLIQIVKLIQKSSSYSKLLQSWRQFGRTLEVDETRILGLGQKLGIGTIEIHDVIFEVLGTWRAEKGNQATLRVLYDALMNCGNNDISELLEKEFWLTAVKSLEIKLRNDVVTLERAMDNASNETFQRIYNALKKNNYTQPIELLKDEVTPRIEESYYVSRTLSSKTQVDERIFKPDAFNNSILLVKGISKSELARLSRFQPVDTSGNQLDEITVKLIVLERDEDFHLICKNTTSPVHFIEYQDGSFVWIKSQGELHGMHRFILGKENRIIEDEFVDKILRTPVPCAFSISDSPGMGKSFLLTSLARKVGSRKSSIVIQIVLDEFIKRINHVNSTSAAIATIVEYACTSEVTKLILENIMNNLKFEKNLFLDAFDEIREDKLSVASSFLNQMKRLQNFRVVITTRPHLRARLENILNVISYKILPFDKPNQIQFLSKYWIENYAAEQNKRLKIYARNCLETLHQQLTDTEQDIAGIPLQCRILAEILGEEAERASKMDVEPTSVFKIASLFDMYKLLVDLKLARLPKDSKKYTSIMYWFKGSVKSNYDNAHVLESINLLFPDWIGKFKPHLKGSDKIKENTLYSIGLIEKSPYKNTARFVHRTFAEYLLAEFLIKNLASLPECFQMFVRVILGEGREDEVDERYPKRSPTSESFKLNYPVVAYFANMHLKDQIRHEDFVNEMRWISNYQRQLSFEDFCKAIAACGIYGFELCFDVLEKLIKEDILDPSDLILMGNKYFKFLPHFAVISSKTSSLVKKVLHITKRIFNTDLSYHVYEADISNNCPYYNYPWIPGSTPLHVAVYYGKYNIVTYLVQEEYKHRVAELRGLMHMCVFSTHQNREPVIENKLSIIDLLLEESKKYNLDWVNDTYEDWELPPFLELNVHLKLLQRLYEHGADVNTCVENSGSVLHWSFNAINYNDLLRWVLSRGFKLIDFSGSQGRTPLMSCLASSGSVESVTVETLQLFHEAGANFNAEDDYNDSVLFHALKGKNTESVIAKVIDYGANINHVDSMGRNAAHILIGEKHQNYLREIPNKLQLLISRGFNLLNQPDSKGRTPFHLFIQHDEILDNPQQLELVELFHSNGVDINATLEDGESLLHRTLILNSNTAILFKLLEYGADIHNRTANNQNALHAAATSGIYSNVKFVIDKFDINSVDDDGHTPLHLLCNRKGEIDLDLLDLFNKRGADFNKADRKGWTALFFAISMKQNSKVISKLIEQGADVYHLNLEKATVIHIAAYHRNYAALEYFIDKKFEINCVDQNGNTPLHSLVSNKETLDSKFLDFCSVHGANFDAISNEDGCSILLRAIKNEQNASIIAKIIEYGGNPYYANSNDENALHIATAYANFSALEFLLNQLNFDINCADGDGDTPLHCVFSMQIKFYQNVLELILSKGCSLEVKNIDGLTPLVKWIIEYNGNEIFQNLFTTLLKLQHLLPITSEMASCAMVTLLHQTRLLIEHLKQNPVNKIFKNFIHLLISKGANFHHCSCQKSSALHIAAKFRNDSALEFLIDKMNIDCLDEDGRTPLHCLVSNEESLDSKLLDWFHAKGADFNATYSNGSVLFEAIRSNQNVSIISKIIEYGGDPYYFDSKRKHAIMLAVRWANSSALEFLLDKFNYGINAIDEDGNIPLHELFSEENKDYLCVFKLLLKSTSKFNSKNNDGHVPLVKWIVEGVSNPIPTLLKLQDLLPITSEIASSALTAMVQKDSFLQKFLINSSEKIEFVQLFSLLINKGARNDESEIAWNRVSPQRLAILDELIVGNELLEKYIRDKCSDSLPLENVILNFSYFAKQSNIPTENILQGLLSTEQWDLFKHLCPALKFVVLQAVGEKLYRDEPTSFCIISGRIGHRINFRL